MQHSLGLVHHDGDWEHIVVSQRSLQPCERLLSAFFPKMGLKCLGNLHHLHAQHPRTFMQFRAGSCEGHLGVDQFMIMHAFIELRGTEGLFRGLEITVASSENQYLGKCMVVGFMPWSL